MRLDGVGFGITDWESVTRVEVPGETGRAVSRTQQFGELRLRMIEYSPGYLADHWCTRGHILLCLSGQLHTELADGRVVNLLPGISYQVTDNAEAHRSSTTTGATLFVVD